jgi:hypothetical protein
MIKDIVGDCFLNAEQTQNYGAIENPQILTENRE